MPDDPSTGEVAGTPPPWQEPRVAPSECLGCGDPAAHGEPCPRCGSQERTDDLPAGELAVNLAARLAGEEQPAPVVLAILPPGQAVALFGKTLQVLAEAYPGALVRNGPHGHEVLLPPGS